MKYLGTIVTTVDTGGGGADGIVDNTNTTGTTFVIASFWSYVLIVTPVDASNKGFGVTVTDVTMDSTNKTKEFDIAGNTSTQIATPEGTGADTIVSIYTPVGGLATGSVLIYGVYGLCQS